MPIARSLSLCPHCSCLSADNPVWSRIVFLPRVRSSGSEKGERTGLNPGLEFLCVVRRKDLA